MGRGRGPGQGLTGSGGGRLMETTERYEAIDLALRAYRRVQDGGGLRRGVVLV